MTPITVISLLAVVGLAFVHLFSNRLRFLDVTPRSVWLSIFGGISVAYVFVHLLPELAEGQETIAEAVGEGEGLAYLESHIYLVALVASLSSTVSRGLPPPHAGASAMRARRARPVRASSGCTSLHSPSTTLS